MVRTRVLAAAAVALAALVAPSAPVAAGATASVAAGATGDRATVVAVTGTNHQVYYHLTGSTGFVGLGGYTSYAPAVMVTPSNQTYVLATGPDHHLYLRTTSAGWRRVDAPTTACGQPAMALTNASGGSITAIVGCRGGNGALYTSTATFTDGGYPSWTSFTSWGGVITGVPAFAVREGGGRPTVFVTGTPAAPTPNVYAKSSPTAAWSRVGSYSCAASPAVSTNGLRTYLACPSANGVPMYAVNSGSGWPRPTLLSGKLVSNPAIVVQASGTVALYGRGTDGALWERSGLPGGSWIRAGGVLLAGVAAAPLARSTAPATGVTRRVDNAYGTTNDPNGESSRALVSGDGRFVVYASEAQNLVPNDTQRLSTDIFRTDMSVNPPRTQMVSVNYNGAAPNNTSTFPAVSYDGRYVVFASNASDLVVADAGDRQEDVFRRDMVTGVTQRVSVTADGHDPGDFSTRPSISEDGRWVAFNTTASLVPGDVGGMDVYLRDMSKSPGTAGWMTRVTGGPAGAADDDSLRAILSGDGNFLTFVSDNASLVPDDTNRSRDVYRWERATHRIVRVSVTSTGGNINGSSSRPWINGDGRFVVFQATAGNVVPGDLNGEDDVFRADFGPDLHAVRPAIERVSVSPSGGNVYGASTRIQINYDGRYVVFASNSHALTPGDRNQARDVFRRDMYLGQTIRVSVDPTGGDSGCSAGAAAGTVSPFARPGAPRLSTRPDISNDGKHVIFVSGSCNLVPNDHNGLDDIFIRDYP